MSKHCPPIKVLVVDDNRDHVFTLQFLIRKLGHEVFTAHDGYHAVAIATSESRPTLILLDLGMPGIHGDEVCKQIRNSSQCEDVTIVALTGYGDEVRARIEDAGFDRHVVKPIHPDLLEEIIDEVSKRQSQASTAAASY